MDFRKFEDLKLRKGISERISEKESYLRNTSTNISQFSNYVSTCERVYTSKLKESLVKL